MCSAVPSHYWEDVGVIFLQISGLPTRSSSVGTVFRKIFLSVKEDNFSNALRYSRNIAHSAASICPPVRPDRSWRSVGSRCTYPRAGFPRAQQANKFLNSIEKHTLGVRSEVHVRFCPMMVDGGMVVWQRVNGFANICRSTKCAKQIWCLS